MILQKLIILLSHGYLNFLYAIDNLYENSYIFMHKVEVLIKNLIKLIYV